MNFIKVKNGLLEEENFFLNSPASDFLGDGIWSRTNKRFTLKSGEIKRKLPDSYVNGFMIVVKKDSVLMDRNSIFKFFIENNETKIGIEESYSSEVNEYWKIIYYNEFIQVYSSNDGKIWKNNGGSNIKLEGDIFQGFSVHGKKELILSNYKVYNSPYLKLQNYEPGVKVYLYDENDNLINERVFNKDYECDIFIDYDLNGYIKLFKDDNLIHTSSCQSFLQGDVFLFSSNNLQLIYQENILDYNTIFLEEKEEKFILKNSGDTEVFNINIDISKNNNEDKIYLSYDRTNYLDKLNIDSLKSNEEIEFYIKIMRENQNKSFQVKYFDINIY